MEQIGSRAERMSLLSNSNIFLYSATRMDVRQNSVHVDCPSPLVPAPSLMTIVPQA